MKKTTKLMESPKEHAANKGQVELGLGLGLLCISRTSVKVNKTR